eukprot:jgi/Astpho2/9838/e_gw1.00149.197.1_t
MRGEGLWHRLAGLSGASSIILATYGSHGFHPADQQYIGVFQKASQYHLAHSLLLALAPLTKRPHITGSLTAVGIGLFSGSLYITAVKEDRSYSQLAPAGGLSLIAAWLSICL